jgi:trehalose utilization protein
MPIESRRDPESSPNILMNRRAFGGRVLAAATAVWGASSAVQAAQQSGGRPAPTREMKRQTPVRVRVWSEGTAPKSVYPRDIDGVLGEALRDRTGFDVSLGRLTERESGLSDESLDATDVLVWWGRLRHDDVPEARVNAIVERVKAGRMGFVALHASCASKPFKALMGTPCEPGGWRDDGKPEHIEVKAPDHPLARGVAPFTIPKTAMYIEPFAVPAPETVVLVSSWGPQETFRSGLTWTIGQGRVVYFRPGHDAFPVFFHASVRQVIANAAVWAAKRS